jgi:hypothetical protein
MLNYKSLILPLYALEMGNCVPIVKLTNEFRVVKMALLGTHTYISKKALVHIMVAIVPLIAV